MSLKTFTMGISGHRVERLKNIPYVQQQLQRLIIKGRADTVVIGMAAGSDLYAGTIALSLGLKVNCMIPWKGHSPRIADREVYNYIKDNANEIHYASNEMSYPGPYIYQVRNEMIIDSSDRMVFVYDGAHYGGTYNAITYTLKKHLDYRVINPDGNPEAVRDG